MKIDWTLIQRPVLMFLVLVLLGSTAVSYVWYRYQDYHRHFVAAQQDHDEALARYQRAESDLALYETYRSRFFSYRQRGVIGEENRLSWAEVLHKQDLALSLPTFNVAISPRQRAQLEPNSPATIHWYQSQQTIKAGLLHEGDFFQILQALQDNADGLFWVDSCRLKKAQRIELSPQSENVLADCVLNWYSLEIQTPQEIDHVY